MLLKACLFDNTASGLRLASCVPLASGLNQLLTNRKCSVQSWGLYWMFMGGGILFLVAGFCYTAALIDHNVLKGMLVWPCSSLSISSQESCKLPVMLKF